MLSVTGIYLSVWGPKVSEQTELDYNKMYEHDKVRLENFDCVVNTSPGCPAFDTTDRLIELNIPHS